MTEKKLKLLFYCQYHWGLGHLIRFYTLALELASIGHKIQFLVGGQPNRFTQELQQKGIQVDYLLPVTRPEPNHPMINIERKLPLDECLDMRISQIEKLVCHQYDALLLESFPFGRWSFKREVDFLIDLARGKGTTKVITVTRDIGYQEPSDEIKRLSSEYLNQRIDQVLILGDGHFVDSISSLELNHPNVRYAGYINRLLGTPWKRHRKPTACVTIAGGAFGYENYIKVIEIARSIRSIEFLFSDSINLPAEQRKDLRATIARHPNMRLFDFYDDYSKVLSECQLSITPCGYNSFLDSVAQSGNPIFLPNPSDQEQVHRHRNFLHLCDTRQNEDSLEMTIESAVKNEVHPRLPLLGRFCAYEFTQLIQNEDRRNYEVPL